MSDIVSLGCGDRQYFGTWHSPHLSMEDVQDRVRLSAVCDPAPGRAKAAGERFTFSHAYETLEELLASGPATP